MVYMASAVFFKGLDWFVFMLEKIIDVSVGIIFWPMSAGLRPIDPSLGEWDVKVSLGLSVLEWLTISFLFWLYLVEYFGFVQLSAIYSIWFIWFVLRLTTFWIAFKVCSRENVLVL